MSLGQHSCDVYAYTAYAFKVTSHSIINWVEFICLACIKGGFGENFLVITLCNLLAPIYVLWFSRQLSESVKFQAVCLRFFSCCCGKVHGCFKLLMPWWDPIEGMVFDLWAQVLLWRHFISQREKKCKTFGLRKMKTVYWVFLLFFTH